MNRRRLISLRMYILGYRCIALIWGSSRCLTILQELKTSLDVYVGWVEIGRTLVCVEGIGCLVVARLVQCSQVVPDFRNIGVQADCARIGIERIAVLVDLVVQHTNAAPEGWVPAVTVYSLLISLVRLRVLLL
jgi:hypothetical protein